MKLTSLFNNDNNKEPDQDLSNDIENIVILDVRTFAEFKEKHVKGAINIDLFDSKFLEKLAKLDKNASYKLYCRSGNRSGQATQIMKTLGFKNVDNIGSVNSAAQTLNLSYE